MGPGLEGEGSGMGGAGHRQEGWWVGGWAAGPHGSPETGSLPTVSLE
jgi:hypothetical protein